ncbi:Monothiol glutaredoxin-4 [Wickerhamiella sorbophila]|uniref:Monothiol glutaredoxin-4 n=1 Tax=Wickerhamiella sorbophila TaxID=45607 RepID=A0A2T0FG74_9ASCO|nr:Monothiol glutaredoxin-4 [Wickerhamiella sorbophila]PRT54002.1 Monothiol glutaredoxin-4 [Wickerhamiella sorbophila]
MSVVEITSDQQFHDITNGAEADKLIVLYFQTQWAEPCVHMNSVFTSLAEIYPQHQFVSVNADDFPDVAELLDVSAVPYFVLLRNRTIIKELSGADPKGLSSAIQAVSADSTQAQSEAAAAATSSGPNSKTATPQNEPEEAEEDLNNRLRKLISAAPVMLFMKGTPAEPKCGFSRQLVAILRENQVRFGFFDILKDNAVRQGLKTYSDWPTFPQLYINGELQGGLDIVKELLKEDPKFFEKAVNQ